MKYSFYEKFDSIWILFFKYLENLRNSFRKNLVVFFALWQQLPVRLTWTSDSNNSSNDLIYFLFYSRKCDIFQINSWKH